MIDDPNNAKMNDTGSGAKERSSTDKKRRIIVTPVPGDSWEWVDGLAAQVRSIGDNVVELIEKHFDGDWKRGADYVGAVLNSSVGGLRKATIEMVHGILGFYEYAQWHDEEVATQGKPPREQALDSDPMGIAEAARFIRDAGVTRDMVDEVVTELGFPCDPADSMPRLAAWITDYLADKGSEKMGPAALSYWWRHVRWRCRQNGVSAGASVVPAMRDGPRVRFVSPKMLRVDSRLRDLLPPPAEQDLVLMRQSIERDRRIHQPIIVLAGELTIIDGHLRHAEALRAGLSEVPILEEFVPHLHNLWERVIHGATGRRQLTGDDRVDLAETVLRLERRHTRIPSEDSFSRLQPVDAAWRKLFETCASRIRSSLESLSAREKTIVGAHHAVMLADLNDFLALADRICHPITLPPVSGGSNQKTR